MSRSRARAAGGIGLIVVLAAAAAGLGYAETRIARSPTTATPTTAQVSDAALAAATDAPPTAGPTSGGTQVPLPAVLGRTLAPALGAGGLGTRVRAQILDVATGRVLLDHGGSTPAAPASTAKLLTAAAVLQVRGPAYRITTRVLAGRSGTIVLVGGGDPTLTGAAGSARAAYPNAARLSGLAAQLRRRHEHVRRIVVDDAAFSGPVVSPAWDADDVPSSYASAITATMTDGGRATPGAVIRSAAPDLAAGHELAAALGSPKLSVSRGVAAAGAQVLASVRSAPIAELIEQMLQESDNVIAECLARQVAMATGKPVTFTGSAAAIRDVLRKLGDDPGAGMVDGSGLAASDRLTTGTLAGLLRLIASGTHPALGAVVAGLPVAGWSGTLDDRFVAGSARSGAGIIRAKTGTLTGVSALAGLVHDASGRLLAFAFIADRTGSTPRAETALDVLAATVAHCGCT